MGKTKKKPYSGSKSFDHTCRNHGSCTWCEGDRTYDSKKKIGFKRRIKVHEKALELDAD